MTGRPVHFWTLRPVDGVVGWDPDRAPARYADAFGHTVLELYVRLLRRGRAVTIGPAAPDHTGVVVVLLEELVSYDGAVDPGAVRRLARAALRCRSVVAIRADLPLAVSPPAFVGAEVMPTRASIVDTRTQHWVPLLPQRGLLPRDPARAGAVETVTYKGYEFNVPAELHDRAFVDALGACGVHLALDTDPATWHDFRRTDVALCLRRYNDAWDDSRHLRKPATKVVNAWIAGAIPLVAPQAAYLELVRPGDDALVVSGPAEIVDAVRRLANDRELVRRLRAGGAARAADFSTGRVLDAWEQLFDADLARVPVARATAAIVGQGARAAAQRARRWLPPAS